MDVTFTCTAQWVPQLLCPQVFLPHDSNGVKPGLCKHILAKHLTARWLLQHVTVTPFRVVDEINQGMDRVNERKVFIQMVDAACRPGTPQCFMFTPKLLPDLPYTYDVMPMTIFNGLHNEELTADYGDVSTLLVARMCSLNAGVTCQYGTYVTC